jgi:hypothetical protein
MALPCLSAGGGGMSTILQLVILPFLLQLPLGASQGQGPGKVCNNDSNCARPMICQRKLPPMKCYHQPPRVGQRCHNGLGAETIVLQCILSCRMHTYCQDSLRRSQLRWVGQGLSSLLPNTPVLCFAEGAASACPTGYICQTGRGNCRGDSKGGFCQPSTLPLPCKGGPDGKEYPCFDGLLCKPVPGENVSYCQLPALGEACVGYTGCAHPFRCDPFNSTCRFNDADDTCVTGASYSPLPCDEERGLKCDMSSNPGQCIPLPACNSLGQCPEGHVCDQHTAFCRLPRNGEQCSVSLGCAGMPSDRSFYYSLSVCDEVTKVCRPLKGGDRCVHNNIDDRWDCGGATLTCDEQTDPKRCYHWSR